MCVCLFVLNIFEYRTFLIWPHFTNYTQVFVVISFQLNLDYISSFVLLQFSSGLFFLSACDIGLKKIQIILKYKWFNNEK